MNVKCTKDIYVKQMQKQMQMQSKGEQSKCAMCMPCTKDICKANAKKSNAKESNQGFHAAAVNQHVEDVKHVKQSNQTYICKAYAW